MATLLMKFIGFGVMDGHLPYEVNIRFEHMDSKFPYQFIGFGGMDGHVPYEVIGFRGHGWPHSL